jgi:hypothetical protein
VGAYVVDGVELPVHFEDADQLVSDIDDPALSFRKVAGFGDPYELAHFLSHS